MGKYEEYDGDSNHLIQIARSLINNANELAEANRLKRLELRLEASIKRRTGI